MIPELRVVENGVPGRILPDWKTLSYLDDCFDVGTLSFEYPESTGVNRSLLTDKAELALLIDGEEVDNGRFILSEESGNRVSDTPGYRTWAAPSYISVLEEILVVPLPKPKVDKSKFSGDELEAIAAHEQEITGEFERNERREQGDDADSEGTSVDEDVESTGHKVLEVGVPDVHPHVDQEESDKKEPPEGPLFKKVTPGKLLRTLVLAGKNRGTAKNLRVDFNDKVDSAGKAWDVELTVRPDVGSTLLDLVQWMHDEKKAEVRCKGRTLQAFNSNTGEDRTKVTLSVGKNITDGPLQRTSREVITTVYVVSDAGPHGWVTDKGLSRRFDRAEGFLSLQGVTKWSECIERGKAYLRGQGEVKSQEVYGVVAGTDAVPYRNYKMADWVYVLDKDGKKPEKKRVRCVTIDWDDEGGNQIGVTLNDRLYERSITANRRAKKVTGKTMVATSIAVTDSVKKSDGRAPARPSPPIVASRNGQIGIGYDGKDETGLAPIWDQDHIEVHVGPTEEYDESDETLVATPKSAGVVTLPSVEYGETVYVKFIAVDAAGDRSEASDVVAISPAKIGEDDVDLPDVVPVDPPVSSPEIRAYGAPTSILIQADPVQPGVRIQYHASRTQGFTADGTTLLPGTPTASTVYVMQTGPDGEPIPADDTVKWYFKAIAENSAGASLDVSDEITGTTDQSAVRELITTILIAGFILAGEIQVGVMTISADQGIKIPQPDGGIIHLPVDGVTFATITCHAILKSAVFQGAVDFHSLATIYGEFVMANGVSTPTQAVALSTTWPQVTAQLTDGQDLLYGLCDNSAGTSWMSVFAFAGLWFMAADKDDGGVLNTQATGTNLTGYAPNGLTRISTNYYTIGQDFNRAGNWYIYRFDSSFAKTGEWLYDDDDIGDPKNPTIGTDGTSICLARWNTFTGADRIVFRTYATSDPSTPTDTQVCTITGTAKKNLTGLAYGSADFGAARIVCMSATGVYVFNDSGSRQTSHEFSRAGGGETRGLWWDGTRFHTIDNSARVWDYSRRVTTANVDMAYIWVAPNGWVTPAGGLVTYSWPARRWLKAEHPPAPQLSQTSNADAARKSSGYGAAAGGALKLQAALAEGTRSYMIDAMDTGSAAAPVTNTFPVAASPGRYKSGAEDADGPLTDFNGAGAARIKGTIGWTNLTLNSPFTAGAVTPQYRKDPVGNVHVRGQIVVNGAADGAAVATLPTGFRPSAAVRCVNDTTPVSTSTGRILVATTGVITAHLKTGTPTHYYLDMVFSTY